MKLSSLLEGIDCRLIVGDTDLNDLIIDSRAISHGACFIPLRGAKSNGHNFINSAINKGCSCVIAEEVSCDISKPYALVEDTRLALGFIASNFYGHPSKEISVIGVTGTNGKTTTSHIISHILSFHKKKVGMIGTTGIQWAGKKVKTPNTTPESVVLQRTLREMVNDSVSELCMEVSSHGLESGRLNGLLFDVGIFLNLTQDHLDFHGNMENYFEAKKRFFTEYLPYSESKAKAPKSIISIDAAYGKELYSLIKGAISFGISGGDYHATEIVSDLDGTRFKLIHPQGETEVSTNLIGAFNVSNILASIAGCEAVGVSVNDSVLALAEGGRVNVDGRLEKVTADPNYPGIEAIDKHVFVDYAHTPDALKKVLMTLRSLTGDKQLWVVFGAGGDRDKSKRPIMGEIALTYADKSIVTNDNPRTEDADQIIRDIIGNKAGEFTIEKRRKAAIERAIFESETGDVILIAGKGHETYQELNGISIAFSDHRQAAKCLDRLYMAQIYLEEKEKNDT